MSQENVEIVRQVVDAINRRDADAFVATVSPDVEWKDAVFWTETPHTFRGTAGVREWLNQILEPWESFHVEADEVTDASADRFVVGFDFTARGKESGVQTQLRFWALCWVADGRITRRARCSANEPKPSKPPGCESSSTASSFFCSGSPRSPCQSTAQKRRDLFRSARLDHA